MTRSIRAYNILEAVAGRRLLWRVGRWLYRGARRELTASIETDGEIDLQIQIARALAASGRRDAVMFDVGANLGEWTLGMAGALVSAGVPASRILAFEPAPDQREALREALSAVPPAIGIEILETAASDRAGETRFEITGAASGNSAILPGETATREGGRSITVPVSTIDAVMAERGIDRIDFMKVDTEGNDLAVIRGAREALEARRVAVIQFEYGWPWARFAHTLHDLMQLAAELDYDFGHLTKGRIETFAEWHPELERYFLTNHVLIAPGAFPSIPRVAMTFDARNVAVPA